MRSHIRRLLESAGFSPRQLFAALQGAWLEPKQGLIWQENTGVTPTTTGGQTIGKIADLSGYGNVATQATAANRPVLGRRYNLLTYSEDFSNAAWAKSGATITANAGVAPDGTTTADAIVEDATLGAHRVRASSNIISGATYTVQVRAKKTNVRYLQIVGSSPTFFPDGNGAWFDFDTGTASAGTGTTATMIALADNWFFCSITVTAASTGSADFYFNPSTSNTGANYQGVNGRESILIWGADLRLTSDVGKDPSYQRITTATDYDYGQYPAVVHDTTDSLSASLPAINVRRNLLTYSEQFDNGVWRAGLFGAHVKPTVTANTGLAPDGTVSAETLTAPHDSASTIGGAFLSAIPGTSYTVSFWIKAGSSTAARIVIAWGTGNAFVSAVSTPALALTNQFIRYTLTGTCPASGVTQLQACLQIGNGTSGALGKTVEVFGAQLELGSVATDYQKITDWTSEAFASSGSVYFATPVGMSQLNNQSMPTTYTLPALSSDIYSWMVFPQRLSAVQESRLALYMQQKAGIAGPDYLLDTADGQLTADDGSEILLAQ